MAIHSVSEVNNFIKQLLASTPILSSIMVRGEISNFKCYASGHCYFTLKDASSALKCVMFRSQAQHLRFQPVNGLSVIASGNIAVYERDGVYQLYVDSLAPEGKGDLALAYEQLKNRLAAEGLFAKDRKKALPQFPKKIGVVTSLSGAVLRDIYHVTKRRWPAVQLVLYPVQVQGEFSAKQVALAIEFFNTKYAVDVMIVGRGGGSMEDLWSFNEEVVVRAIAASKIPIISAVGHETDFSLADFAADVRAATPSQAAELAVPDRDELKRYVVRMQRQLAQMARRELNERRLRLQACQKNKLLQRPELLLADRRQRLDNLISKLRQCLDENITVKNHQLSLALEKLSVLNPAKTLQRGFALVEHGGKIVTRVQEVKKGDKLQLTFSDGKVSVVAADLTRKGD
ncbi:MAG: exodeoxyribonuclease VII large subunit [Selenomonas sp.]|nr:exodeoxyribonuclease VII large subunit [Selenomonadales bacterium]MDD7762405.1 exodeoxyribonuclease VII large subunit [Selenomonadales bacterium]MDY5716458.1 exodeoxyribonuclease VII large subunit [Selenomonas sp.]